MTITSKYFSGVALILITSACSFGALKPCGFITDGKESRFVFADTESGKRLTWIAVGQSFWDYTVVGFDQKQEILFIKRGQEVIPLGLKTENVIEVTNPSNSKPVLVSMPGRDAISVTDDVGALNELKERLSRLASVAPESVVTIQVPTDSEISRIRAVARLVRASGLKRINFALGQTSEKIGLLLK